MKLRLLNITIRFSALSTRFAFVLSLVFFLSPQEIGIFGLVTASIGYLIHIMGLEFYVYANREICGSTLKNKIIKNSIFFYGINYLITLPLISVIFLVDFLPKEIIYKFYALLILEHLGQEVYRLLVILEKPILASVSLFLRVGAWAVILSMLMYFMPALRNIDTILNFWIFGAIFSLMIGAVVIKNLMKSNQSYTIDWQWILFGLKTSIPFLLSALCLKGVTTIDRFWIEKLTSPEVLGAYVFFVVLTNSLIAILEAGVFSFMMPKLIQNAKNNNKMEYTKNFKTLWQQTSVVILFFSIISSVALPILLKLVENPIYSSHIALYYLCLISVILLSASMIFNLGLYSQRKDSFIIISHIIGFLVFIAATLMISKLTTYYAIPIGVIISYLSILLLKYYFYQKNYVA